MFCDCADENNVLTVDDACHIIRRTGAVIDSAVSEQTLPVDGGSPRQVSIGIQNLQSNQYIDTIVVNQVLTLIALFVQLALLGVSSLARRSSPFAAIVAADVSAMSGFCGALKSQGTILVDGR